VKRRSRPCHPPAASPPPTPSWHIRACAICIVVAGAFTYANSLSNPFVLDDRRSVIENRQIRQLWPLSAALSPPPETPVARRPLVNLSFAVNYAVGGLDVRGYHIGNLIIHLLAALLLFGTVRRTLVLGELAARFGTHATILAAICSAIWALHPLNSEIVNYLSQRTTGLMGLFYLLTLYCSIRALRPGGYWTAAAICACTAGVVCKEAIVTAPVLVMLFDRVFAFRSFREAARRRRALYLGLAGSWIVLGMLMTDGSRTTVGFNAGVDASMYLLNQVPVLAGYLQLVLWPRTLVVDYGLPRPLGFEALVWRGAALAGLLIGAFALLRLRPRAGFPAVAVFILLAPTSSIVPIATEVGAERRMYLPLAAIVALAVCLAYRGGIALLNRLAPADTPRRWDPRRLSAPVAWSAVCVVCAILAAGTHLRNREYRSEVALAAVTAERRPHGRAHYALAHALLEDGRRDEAFPHLWRSSLDFPPAHFVLGSELLVDGDIEAGVAQLRRFVSLVPRNSAAAGAHQTIAAACMDQGRYDEAIKELETALRLQPDGARAHMLIGEALLHRRRVGEAIDHLQRAAGLWPRNAQIRDLLGNALALAGRFAEAEVQFELAIQADPGHVSARDSLAKLERWSAGRF
jgi:protein O-mannosyl-transferase